MLCAGSGETMRELEHQEQAALFRWAKIFGESKYPGLHLMHASANGGKRNIRVAMKLKASGVKAGVPDIFLPVPRNTGAIWKAGLYIEMKSPGNKPTAIQKQWHEDLRAQGYRVVVCYSWQEAVEVIKEYYA